MDSFFQLHLLIPYGPSNPNRDDTGQPKSARVGGAPRLRISSQSLKRAWRTSDVFRDRLEGSLGERTRRIGEVAYQHLLNKESPMPEAEALPVARLVARIFGDVHKKDDKHPTYTKQLVFVSPQERSRAIALADSFASGERDISQYDLDRATKAGANKVNAAIDSLRGEVLQHIDRTADIAMFGRMLADSPQFNREAAVQVSHAITTHRAEAEDDFYSAVDDLKPEKDPEDSGAGFYRRTGVRRRGLLPLRLRRPPAVPRQRGRGRRGGAPRQLGGSNRGGGDGVAERQTGQLRQPGACDLRARRKWRHSAA